MAVTAQSANGKAVAERLSGQHEMIIAGYSSGDVQVDLASADSIRNMFEQVGKVDAVVSTAGQASFAPLQALTDDDYQLALQNKLMGQVNLVRIGRDYVTEGGSITLTSGVLSRQPMPGSAAISMVNGALESYVKAAALELNQLKLNVVAPVFVKETMAMMGMDTEGGVSASDTAKAYVVAVEGDMHGQTLDITHYI
ncbi:short chain dehydrogenase [Photobacterium sanctipauli]|uniref:short chain dehydrogenase n=2 Tax=Photobacterium sanctipauli TaxID=1342794 RepID=UPI001FE6414F|nr:short chain dehydrogenase [Photobacterium sanctipauli]